MSCYLLLSRCLSYGKYGMAAGLLLSLLACGSSMPLQPGQLAPADQAYSEYRSSQVEVVMIRQKYLWNFPDAYQHLRQFSEHVQVDGQTPVQLQEFVVSYRKQQPYVPNEQANATKLRTGDEVQISKNGESLVSTAIAPAFTGQQSYRRLEVAKLQVGNEAYVLTVANGFLHRPMWLAIYGADGRPVYRIELPHGTWQFTEHADGISMVDTSGSGRRLVIRPALH